MQDPEWVEDPYREEALRLGGDDGEYYSHEILVAAGDYLINDSGDPQTVSVARWLWGIAHNVQAETVVAFALSYRAWRTRCKEGEHAHQR